MTIDQASGQADPTTTSPINFTVVFSETVSDFATGDVTLSGTAGATTAVVTGSGTTYNVAVSGMTTRGTVIASLAAGVAHDAATNASTASTATDNTVTWDRVPSATVSLDNHTPTTNQTITATATKSDPDGDAVTLTYVWKVGSTTVKTTAGSASLTDTLDLSQAANGDKGQTVSVEVTPNDGLFNGSTVSDNATVQNTAPTVTLSGLNDLSANEGSTHTYSYTISDADGDTIASVATSCGTNGTTTNTSNTNTSGSFDCTFVEGPGSSTVSAQATDSGFGAAAGNNATQTVTVNNVAPTVTLLGPASANEGDTKSYTYSWTDPGTADTFPAAGNSVSCGTNGTASAVVFTPASKSGSFDCTWSDDSGAGTVTVSASVTDDDTGLGSDSKSVSVTNVAPNVTLLGPATADEGDTKSYTYSWTDPGTGDTFPIAG